jgi:LuxR family quorum-sensing system transcriptional regulator SolR
MPSPVNFDSITLDSMLADWISALREYAVEAVVVLGPDPFGQRQDRVVAAVHPPRLQEPALALAESQDFGAPWRESDAPLVAWQHIANSDTGGDRWRLLWLAHGFQSVVRVEFPLPSGRAFECFMFSPRQFHDRAEAAALVWSALNIWPLFKRTMAAAGSPLSPRESECLALAFEGLTARQTGERLHCTERTVNYHMANAMAKLRVDNKMSAIQRACWMGVI